MHDMRVILENVPGTLASLGEALGDRSVNIEGGYTVTVDGKGVAHVLVEDVAKATAALEAAGLSVDGSRDAISIYVSVDDRPGILGRYARRIAEAGVNIERCYVAAGSRLVFVTDDNMKARAALRGI
jgi:hypothetical protein